MAEHITSLVDETNTLLLRAERSNRTQVWQQLTQIVFNAMKTVAEGNHHPAARINAALILSRLDRLAANNQTRSPPVPLIQTYPNPAGSLLGQEQRRWRSRRGSAGPAPTRDVWLPANYG